MRFLHGLFGLLMVVLMLALGAALVYGATIGAQNCYWLKAVDILQHDWIVTLGAGAAILLLVALYLVTFWRPRASPKQFISYDGRGGRVSICIKTIRDFIQTTTEEFSAVISMHPTLAFRGGSLDVELELRVAAGTQIPELCQMLQERVKERLHDELGLRDVRSVKVNVREIVGRPTDKPKSLTDAAIA
ncbi:MAG: alkaline shock response membrane anchor protein AmaP [Spartobacteria bacterium]|nr:alkaline shock response membrane anchor protein AmaP [Spartobacteria bacterium]